MEDIMKAKLTVAVMLAISVVTQSHAMSYFTRAANYFTQTASSATQSLTSFAKIVGSGVIQNSKDFGVLLTPAQVYSFYKWLKPDPKPMIVLLTAIEPAAYIAEPNSINIGHVSDELLLMNLHIAYNQIFRHELIVQSRELFIKCLKNKIDGTYKLQSDESECLKKVLGEQYTIKDLKKLITLLENELLCNQARKKLGKII